MSAVTASSVKKLVMRVRRISKDISVRRSSVDYHRSKIRYHEELISKLLEDLRQTTEHIALRTAMSGSLECAQMLEDESDHVMNSPQTGSSASPMELLPPLRLPTLDALHSTATRCCETLWEQPSLCQDPSSMWSGSGDLPELGSPDWLMNDSLELLLRSQERSGGQDIC